MTRQRPTWWFVSGSVSVMACLLAAACRREPEEAKYQYRIEDYQPAGTVAAAYRESATLSLELAAPRAIAVDREDRIYVGGAAAVAVFAPDGSPARTQPLPVPATALTVDANGDLYVVGTNILCVFNSAGRTNLLFKLLNEETYLTSVAVSDERVYLADAGNRMVLVYGKGGTDLAARIGDDGRGKGRFAIPSPHFDVAVGQEDSVWVVDPGRHIVGNYAPDGALRTSWGRTSLGVEGFCGCCNPTDIALLPDGSFATSEKGVVRVKIYDPAGAFKALVAGPDRFNADTVGLDLAADGNGRVLVLDPARCAVRIFEPMEATP